MPVATELAVRVTVPDRMDTADLLELELAVGAALRRAFETTHREVVAPRGPTRPVRIEDPTVSFSGEVKPAFREALELAVRAGIADAVSQEKILRLGAGGWPAVLDDDLVGEPFDPTRLDPDGESYWIDAYDGRKREPRSPAKTKRRRSHGDRRRTCLPWEHCDGRGDALPPAARDSRPRRFRPHHSGSGRLRVSRLLRVLLWMAGRPPRALVHHRRRPVSACRLDPAGGDPTYDVRVEKDKPVVKRGVQSPSDELRSTGRRP